MMSTAKFTLPKIGLTADVAWFHARFNHNMQNLEELYVLLIRRGGEPCKGYWALPGGFIEENETLEEGAARELIEETGDWGNSSPKLHFVNMLDSIDRDPRGRTVSALFTMMTFGGWGDKFTFPEVQAGDDAVDTQWIRVKDIYSCNVAFDHCLATEWAYEKCKEIYKVSF